MFYTAADGKKWTIVYIANGFDFLLNSMCIVFMNRIYTTQVLKLKANFLRKV